MSPTNDNIAQGMLFFISGAMFALLISIFDAGRRTAARLAAGCFLGGIGALLAGQIFAGSKYQLLAAGVAAVITENIVIGLVKASRDFSTSPLKTFAELWGIVSPTFNIFKRGE